ncbi:MAG: winged helix-turn-helix transcriptional regulator [Chloroflexota bacterium]
MSVVESERPANAMRSTDSTTRAADSPTVEARGAPRAGTARPPGAERQPAGDVDVSRRALVVVDDDDYAVLLTTLLRRDGWEVERERGAVAGIERLSHGRFGVVLVDASLLAVPDGGAMLARIRGASSVPVIALTNQDAGDDLMEEAVAADYDLVKPFSPRRLRAAVRAVVRRGRLASPAGGLPAEVRVGDVAVSLGRLEVRAGDRQVELSPREFALLHLLMAHPGTVFTRDELARLAWGWRGNPDSRAVDNTVRRLRQKIEPDPRRPRHLLTERGAGYRFGVP